MLDLMNRRDERLAELVTDSKYNEMAPGSAGATIDNAICQTLYLLLLQQGPIVLPDTPIPAAVVTKVVGRRIFPLLANLIAIAKMLLPAVRDGLMRLYWRNDSLRAEKLERHALMVESGVNMLLQEQRDQRNAAQLKGDDKRFSRVLSEPCRRAVALATGVDIDLLVTLREARMQRLIDLKVGVRRGRTLWVASALLTPEIDAIFRKLTLDLSTVEHFRAPCFLDMGPLRPAAGSVTTLIAETAAINWTAYYPCYVAQSSTNGSRVYLTSPRIWHGMLMAFAQRPAYALHQAHETLARDAAKRDELSELRTLIRQTHRETEELAGQAARDAGWRCRTSVEAFGATRLPEGEIDLLATADIGDMSVILLAEVKNSDNAMSVPAFSERVAKLVTHAELQLRRKGSWIAQHWRDTLNFLGSTSASSNSQRRLLLRVIVTARPTGGPPLRGFSRNVVARIQVAGRGPAPGRSRCLEEPVARPCARDHA